MAVRPTLCFSQNNLVISSVDIQSVEPVDRGHETLCRRASSSPLRSPPTPRRPPHDMRRSVWSRRRGKLERQKIMDQAEAERARKELLELEAQSVAVESTGAAKAEAQSRAEAARIQGEAAVNEAKLKAEAQRIEAVRLMFTCPPPQFICPPLTCEGELLRLSKAREQELSYKKEMDQLEVEKQGATRSDRESEVQSAGGEPGQRHLKEMAEPGQNYRYCSTPAAAASTQHETKLNSFCSSGLGP
ncbi:hypothetical protein INR49_022910 [Caranx melampygus]|nr:hypothetical protein INR49_022910 [Caranx melampygus]